MFELSGDRIPRREALRMQMPGNFIVLIFLGMFMWQFLQPALQTLKPAEFPTLTGRVVDGANVLDAQSIARITSISEELEGKTGAQLVAVTLNDLQGRTIEEYGYQLGRHWQIGRKDHDDGVLLIAAPGDRVVRIEVGYGLEGVLTDAASSVIIQNDILPRFRENDLPGGMVAGATAISTLITGVAPEERRGDVTLTPVRSEQGRQFDFLTLVIPLLFLLFPLIQIARFIYALINPAYGAELVQRPRRGRGGGGGWGGGSGGGGGFRGRGGSFGGGGASGRW